MIIKRFRRLRQNTSLRSLVKSTNLDVSDFVYPLFVIDGKGVKNKIDSMPGIFQMSIDEILLECKELCNLGIYAIMLFGIPSFRDGLGSEACSEDSIISKTIKAIKRDFKDMIIITDLCFCEYTDHGHCGILNENIVDNDKTLEILNKQALIHLRAGADMIAPSGMMDGVISSLRACLDKNGFENSPIMSYSTKFASSYYGPFRDIANSAPSFGDRKSYQMDYNNADEAINESLEDEKEGADILMVKPALAYLDIVYQIKQASRLPLAVYNVSGEYAMIKYAALNNLIDYKQIVLENMFAFKRAGADIIISYHAKEVASWLSSK